MRRMHRQSVSSQISSSRRFSRMTTSQRFALSERAQVLHLAVELEEGTQLRPGEIHVGDHVAVLIDDRILRDRGRQAEAPAAGSGRESRRPTGPSVSQPKHEVGLERVGPVFMATYRWASCLGVVSPRLRRLSMTHRRGSVSATVVTSSAARVALTTATPLRSVTSSGSRRPWCCCTPASLRPAGRRVLSGAPGPGRAPTAGRRTRGARRCGTGRPSLRLSDGRTGEQRVAAGRVQGRPARACGVRAPAHANPRAVSDQAGDSGVVVAELLGLPAQEDTLLRADGLEHVVHAREVAPPCLRTRRSLVGCGYRPAGPGFSGFPSRSRALQGPRC